MKKGGLLYGNYMTHLLGVFPAVSYINVFKQCILKG